MSQKNPKEGFHNTAYSVQLPYIAGHSLKVTKTSNSGTQINKIEIRKLKMHNFFQKSESLCCGNLCYFKC